MLQWGRSRNAGSRYMRKVLLRPAALLRTLSAVTASLLVLSACAENRLEASVKPVASRLAVTADRVRNRAAGRRRTLRMYRLPAFRERPHCSMRFDTNAPLGRLMLFESRRSDRFPDRWQKPGRQELMGRRTPAARTRIDRKSVV